MRETRIRSLGREDPLEKAMATHSNTLAWKIPWMEEPGRLQFMGSQRVGHEGATSLHFTPRTKLRMIGWLWEFKAQQFKNRFIMSTGNKTFCTRNEIKTTIYSVTSHNTETPDTRDWLISKYGWSNPLHPQSREWHPRRNDHSEDPKWPHLWEHNKGSLQRLCYNIVTVYTFLSTQWSLCHQPGC